MANAPFARMAALGAKLTRCRACRLGLLNWQPTLGLATGLLFVPRELSFAALVRPGSVRQKPALPVLLLRLALVDHGSVKYDLLPGPYFRAVCSRGFPTQFHCVILSVQKMSDDALGREHDRHFKPA
jgi:hypothetical protein